MNKIAKIIIIVIIAVGIWLLKADLNQIAREDSEIGQVYYMVEANVAQNLYSHVDTGGSKLIALTFDDGPDPNFTPIVLEILKQHQITATFFVVGQQAEQHPELIKKAIQQGCEVENHTYTHPDVSKYNRLQIQDEIVKTHTLIEKITKQTPHYFRPPKKLYNTETMDVAESLNYKMVLWGICIENQRSKTISDMAQRIIDAAGPGVIILGHDGRLNRTRTMEALPQIIEGIQEKGYQFVTLDELFAAQGKY